MKESRLLGAVCACLFTLLSMSSEAAIIDFDSLEVANSNFNFIGSGIYSEDGFSITGTPMYYNGQFNDNYYAGSAGLYLQGAGAVTTLQHSASNVFSIDSIGLSFFRDGGTSPLVTFTGYLSGGGTVTQSFQPLSFGFADFFFDSGFTNLTSLSWNQGPNGGNGHQFDNIVLFDSTVSIASTVPIPAAVWLFGSGLLGLAGMTRRKKA